jgi:membrane protease YdiL (CAAX protease family)
LINVVLLARDLVGEGTDSVTASVVILSTVLYALAALSLAARVFGAESVLYSEQSGWSDLVRRPETPRATATIPAMLWCLALMIPLQFVLLAMVRPSDPAAVSSLQVVALSVAANAVVFGLLPALFAYLGRVQPISGLGLTLPRGSGWAVGLLLAVSLWPWQLWLLSFGNTAAMLEERFGNLLRSLGDARQSLGWFVLIVVIVPAILEEVFFRGLLFNALKAKSGAWITIGASAVLFGLSHVMLPGSLGLDRLVPSTALGLILGTVRWRTGSLWPCMIQHVGHNAILLGVGLQAPGSTSDIPWEWLTGGAVATGLAAVFLWRLSNSNATQLADGTP